RGSSDPARSAPRGQQRTGGARSTELRTLTKPRGGTRRCASRSTRPADVAQYWHNGPMAKKQARTLPHQTRNDLPPATRAKMVALLHARLADTLDLVLQAKQAHWNVKGPDFYQLHELFDEVAAAARAAVDDLAERAVQLGGIAEGTVQVVNERTTIRAYPLAIADGSAHLKALADALATVARAP